MEELLPVCKFDPAQHEKYRNGELLRQVLRKHIQSYADAGLNS